MREPPAPVVSAPSARGRHDRARITILDPVTRLRYASHDCIGAVHWRRSVRAPAGSPRGDLDGPAGSPSGMGRAARLWRTDGRRPEYLGSCVCFAGLNKARVR
ncbi:hypothetical protein RGQ21_78260 [Kitasatospora aureofaciens]|nr:hypothetical protein RGQ21_78260 [Kitasatospora aureofaciens]